MLFFLCSIKTYAADISQASVDYSEGVYTINFDATITAPQKKVYSILTDYAHLNRFNDNIIESSLLDDNDSMMEKCRLLLHTCILFFCRNATLIEIVNDNNKDEVTTMIIPDGSDFLSGHSVWKILPVDAEHTSIVLYQQLEPDFWYPPVIGPWLIKKKVVQELSIMLNRVEQLASVKDSY